MTTPRTDLRGLVAALRAAAAAALLVPCAALGAVGIASSAHDLAASSASTVKAVSEQNTCKFCHTPHRAESTKLLWNHTQTSQATYSWKDELGDPKTATQAGTPLPTTMRPESKRCLGCHDGSVSVGDTRTGTIAIAPVAGRVDASGHLTGPNVVGAGGDLTGQHPVGVPYAGQVGYNGITSAVPAAIIGTGVKGGYFGVKSSGCNSSTGFCTTAPASAGVDGSRINLIPQAAGSNVVGVECTTCHEPHNKFGFLYMMRVDTAFDALCQSCHNK